MEPSCHLSHSLSSPFGSHTVTWELDDPQTQSDALLTATEGFEPSASGNLPSGQQSVAANRACCTFERGAKRYT